MDCHAKPYGLSRNDDIFTLSLHNNKQNHNFPTFPLQKSNFHPQNFPCIDKITNHILSPAHKNYIPNAQTPNISPHKNPNLSPAFHATSPQNYPKIPTFPHKNPNLSPTFYATSPQNHPKISKNFIFPQKIPNFLHTIPPTHIKASQKVLPNATIFLKVC